MSEERSESEAGPEASTPSGKASGWRGETFWGWIKVTARLWGFLAFILLVVVIFRQVILPFILALLVTYVLHPVLRRLSEVTLGGRRLPRAAWVALLYLVLLGLSALFVTSFVPRLSNDVKRIWSERHDLVHKVKRSWLPNVAQWMERNFVVAASEPIKPADEAPRLRMRHLPDGTLEIDARSLRLEVVQRGDDRWLIQAPGAGAEAGTASPMEDTINRYVEDMVTRSGSRVQQLLQLGQRFVVGLVNLLTTFILVFMISAFLLLDSGRILGWLRNLIPPEHHTDFENVVRLIDRALGGAIRGQLLICVVNGVLTGIGLVLLQVKYAFLLALLAGVMSLIPIFGSILSTIPIVTVALVSGTSGLQLLKGLLVLAWIIGIHLIEANLLNPKIIGTAAKIHPVIVIFAVVAGERTYGAIGALLAVPIVSAVQTMFIYMRAKVRGELDELGVSSRRRRPSQIFGG